MAEHELKCAAALLERRCAIIPASNSALDLAILFHDTYERLAPQFGYETRPETRKFSPSSPNGQLMRAVCEELLKALRAPVEPAAKHERTEAQLLAEVMRTADALRERFGVNLRAEPSVDVAKMNRAMCEEQGHVLGIAVRVCHRCHAQYALHPDSLK